MPLKKKKVFDQPPHLLPVRGRAAREIAKGKAAECLALSPGAWAAPKLRQSQNCTPIHSHLRALFGRLKARRGPRKAIIAVAAAILTSAYWMLRRGVAYTDLGPDHFDRVDRTRLAARLARKLDELGFDVTLSPRRAV